ncbi:MBL fold metallo-hydrolase [Kiritimatiellaeota bacterium B1221]|nr:MBL fold metallo-hydrolase [Kiritimatiellaeota bacterium B1221]
MKLTFLGAARNVTGSCTLIETNDHRILIDCGYFQERKFQDRNWDDFPVDPASIDLILMTHAHLDHCGLLPRWVAKGFRGDILATSATKDIIAIILRDSARIQQEDMRQKQKRHLRQGKKARFGYDPLYTVDDAEHAIGALRAVPFYEAIELFKGVRACWYEAGHILGAGSIRLEVEEAGTTKSVLFSGDIGRSDMPLLRDPTSPPGADTLVIESTYGNRTHAPKEDIPGQLADIINSTHEMGGNLIIPSFAVERTQDLFYHFTELLSAKRIPHTMVFLDSPMAVRVTDVFRKHKELFDDETMALLESGHHPCNFSGLKMAKSRDQSKAINQIKGTICVIAGSGMCTGGRIKHHLLSNISREESTILFVGYQAEGTLGRHILSGPEEVRIMGQMCPVKARIAQINGFSGHADQTELKHWMSGLDPQPQKILINHGEEKVAMGFASDLAEETGAECYAPEYRETLEL